MEEANIRKYIFSQEFFQMADQVSALVGVNPRDPQDYEKDGALFNILAKWFEEKLSDEELKGLAQRDLGFLSEEEINKVVDFIIQNFSGKREEVWQQIKTMLPETEEELEMKSLAEESYEEKSRRYLSMMQDILKLKKGFGEEIKPAELSQKREIQERVSRFKQTISSNDEDEKFLDLSNIE